MSEKTINWLLSWKANNRALQMPRHSLSTMGSQYFERKNDCTYNCTPMWFTLFKSTVCLGRNAKLSVGFSRQYKGGKVHSLLGVDWLACVLVELRAICYSWKRQAWLLDQKRSGPCPFWAPPWCVCADRGGTEIAREIKWHQYTGAMINLSCSWLKTGMMGKLSTKHKLRAN